MRSNIASGRPKTLGLKLKQLLHDFDAVGFHIGTTLPDLVKVPRHTLSVFDTKSLYRCRATWRP